MLREVPRFFAFAACLFLMGCSDQKKEETSSSPIQAQTSGGLPQEAPVHAPPCEAKLSAPKVPPPMSPIEGYARKIRPGHLKRKLMGVGPQEVPDNAPSQETSQECKERIKARYEACVKEAKDDDAKLAVCEKFRVWFKGRCGGGAAPEKEGTPPPKQTEASQASPF